MTRTIEDQEIRSNALMTQITQIQARGDTENRDLTEVEANEVGTLLSEFDTVRSDIDRRRAIERNQQFLNGAAPAPGARQANGNGQGSNNAPPARNGAPAPYRVEVVNRAAGTFGFNNIGEFAIAVRNSSIAGRVTDPRLLNANGAPPDNYMSEGVGPDGGYAVPPDFRPAIQSLVMGADSLLSQTDLMTTASNAITFPVDSTTPWQTTGGIQAYWEAEAGEKKTSKLPLDQITVKLNKLYALVAVTDELLEDAPALTTLMNRKVPEKLDFAVTDAILNGTGNLEPQGIYTSPATIVVPREAGQAPGTIVAANILKMWARCYAPARNRAVWIANQDIEDQFITTFIPIKDGAGAVVNGQLTYMPPGGLSGAPYSTLMGRPVIVTEAAPAAGSAGDLALVDLKSYLSAEKVGGVKQDLSIHVFFLYDISCFRWVLRLGGTPWWKAPITNKAGSVTRSPFVILGADGGGGTTGTLGTGARPALPAHLEPPHPIVEGAGRSNEAVERAEEARRRK